MRLPDDTSQIRLAPVRALRAVFSGVGQLLLAADRLREEDARQEQESGDDRRDAPASWDGRLSPSVRLITPAGLPAQHPRGGKSAAGAEAGPGGRKRKRPATAAAGAAGTKAGSNGGGRKSGRTKAASEPPRFRSLDLTGNVRMLTDQDIADPTTDQLEPAAPAAAGTTAPSWSEAAPPWSSWSKDAADLAPPAARLPISGYDELSLPSLRARLRNLDAVQVADLLVHERSHANREDVVTMFERRIAKLEEEPDGS